MWPTFIVRVLQGTDWPMFVVQLLSAAAIFWAAWYAAHYTKKKDEKESRDKLLYIKGRVTMILEKSKFFLERIPIIKVDEKNDDIHLKSVSLEIINLVALMKVFRIEDDLDFLIKNDEIINSYITSTKIKISEFVLDYHFFLYTYNEQTDFKMIDAKQLNAYIKHLKKRIIVVRNDFEKLSIELEIAQTKLGNKL